MRLTVVANPENRRLRLFAEAARAAGYPAPRVIAWRDVASGQTPRFGPHEWVRIESPGENAEVERLLRGVRQDAAHGEIIGLRAWYVGFARALHRIAEAADEGGARMLNDVGEILAMCDKRACHSLLRQRAIAVPPALTGISGYAGLRRAMLEAGWSRVFVKPAHGSPASGVLALAAHQDRVQATTSVELDGGRLFNSLRVRTYTSAEEIARIVDALGGDGLHVERWFPKAGLGDRVIDLRVVVIAGRPSHVVVRSSRHPMTNLHLGGARGDLATVRRAAGDAYDAAMATCAAVGACFPRSLHVGVDLMFAPGWRRHAVAEANAFGDLLPGLLVDGRDTYSAQLAALAAGPVAPLSGVSG